jgi:hypothetical protein
MRRPTFTLNTLPSFLMLFASTAAFAQEGEVVGQVVSYKADRSFIYHEVSAANPSPQEAIDGNIFVHHTDVLEAKDKGKIEVKLIPSGNIEIESGRMHLLDGPDGGPVARVEGGLVRVEGELDNYTVVTDLITTDPWGTIYEVIAEPRESRVFVYEGTVAVTSTNPRYAEPVLVRAGEWVRAREGEPVSEPKVFILSKVRRGPGSGASECIYSNCKINDNVLIPERPVVTPGVLIPPPPNPPGRR